jgi:amino acid adenylation domain-containing protein
VVEHPASHRALEALTPRETEVLRMIVLGLTNAQIAARLDVTVHAVKFHLGHVYRKLGVSNRTEAAVLFHDLEQNGGTPDVSPVPAEWNATEKPFPSRCIHDLFEEAASARPAAIAVVDGYGSELTYAELDRRTNKLAHHLRALGAGPDVLVGIAVTRSTAMLVGLLGILKAGAAYVPIDPNYPSERVAYMLDNAQAPVLVTEEGLLATLPPTDAKIVCLDRDWQAVEAASAARPQPLAEPENLAYVIYTSGSTGNPKGVEIPHRALVNFVTTMREAPGLSADDVLLAVTTLSFDIAGLELYLPLVSGARVVVAPEPATANPAELERMLEDHGVTVMQATPTTWRLLVDAGWPGRAGLKALCGGEALPLALADALVERDLELWNMYGPTETTIWSTTRPVTTVGEPLTIGRPIANTTLFVLDEDLRPVEVGTAGELHIGGAGLARGYRGRPDLTAERFLPSPFAEGTGERIYKTGDLVRYRDNGEVEYLGRLDHQVKIRGFRIELGEIETVLSRHPAVREAVAVAREDHPGDPRIVAYVRQDDSASAPDLREHVGRSLPAYMIPSAVVSLDRFPLTPNGKIDRKALPAPVYARSEAQELVPPRTRTEKRLATIWQEELGVDRVGIHDDFFDLGATSVAAAHVIARIQRTLAKDLALTPIFEARTIEQLARLIDSGDTGARWTSLVPMQTSGTREPIFCVHGGAGTIVHLDPLARRLADERPFYGLQSQGLYGGAPPLETVDEMATHYLAEIRSVQPHGPYYLAGYCFGTIAAFEMAQRLVAEGEEVALLAMFNGPSPSWIKTWGIFLNQPRFRQARQAVQKPPASLPAKVVRVLRDPQRIRKWIAWGRVLARRRITDKLEGPRVRWSLKRGRPLPEWLRESYFLRLHARAERAYQPSAYPGELLVFSGEGMYDDLTLGWEGLAQNIQTYVVPGDHKDNRDMMRPQNVGFVADILTSYCENGSETVELAAAGAQ